MADSSTPKEENADSSGGWWDSWLSSAKSKSAEVYSMVRKDLEEVSTAVRNEASLVYTATSSVLEKTLKLDEPESTANVMKKSLSSFIGQMSEALSPEPDDEDTEVILSTGDTTVLSTYKAELEALQRLDATFLVPADSPEYDAWKSSLEGDIADGVISASAAARRLKSEQLLASQYEKLVPDAVDHQLFWERYLFRVALLQDRLAAVSRQGAAAIPHTNDPVLARLPLQVVPIVTEPKATETASEAKEQTPAASAPSTPGKSPFKSSASLSETPSLVEPSLSEDIDEGVAWEEDFASDVELTEEQQTLLLQEYEKEIASKKQLKTTKDTNVNAQAKSDKQASETSTQTSKPSRPAKQTGKVTQNKEKTYINAKELAKSNVNAKTNQKSAKGNDKIKNSDVYGNNLVEDHFKAEQKTRDDTSSSNSDESWEKEFEVESTA